MQGLGVGPRWTTPAGAPSLGGVVEYLTENPYDALLRLDTPGPGIVAIGAATYPGGERVVAMNLYAYGDEARDIVDRTTPVWQEWFQQHFPAPVST